MCNAWTDMQAECEQRGRILGEFEILHDLPGMDDEKAIDQIMKKHNLSREEVERCVYNNATVTAHC